MAQKLIVVVILGLLGTAGWLVYDRQKSDADSRDTTSQSSQQEQEMPKNQEIKQASLFEIKELGVKFELTDSLAGLYYSMGNNDKTAYFSLNELKDTDCAADKTAQAALTRYTDVDFNYDPIASKEQARKIGNYYYMSNGGQAGCSADEKVQEKAAQLRADLLKLLPGALLAL